MVFQGIKTLDDADIKKKKVLLRVDYNVPLAESGDILDDFRIKESLPTIKKLLRKGAKQVIIMTHLGRPEGKINEKFRLNRVAQRLSQLIKKNVEKLNDCVNIKNEISLYKDSQIIMLENLRFHEEEEINGAEFAKELASLADIYVNDAFGVSHREHASVHAILRYIPGYIGLLVEKELRVFSELTENPEHPFMAIIGGSKLETKLPLITKLLDKTEKILLGGAMIFTFYKAKGYSTGKSLVDKNSITMAKMLGNNEKIILPIDIAVADDKDNPTQIVETLPRMIPSYMMGLDLGRKSIQQFKQELTTAKTVVWNGPLGYYENKKFMLATVAILKYLANREDIKTIIGGGDTASIVQALKLEDKFYHVSTGGGASLTLLEGKTLPGIEALRNQK